MDADNLSKGEQTRLQILQAAHDLFAEQGFHATSMRQIAEAAGIALGGIYNHFGGKEEIFEAAFIEFHPIDEIIPALVSAPTETVPETIHFAADEVLRTMDRHGDYLSLLFVELIEFRGRHLKGVFARVFPQGVTMARKMFDKKGTLREKNVPIALFGFLSMLFSYAIFTRAIDQHFLGRFLQLDIHKLIDIFLYGVMADKPEA